MKNQWYDEQLSSAIQKLERFYLTFIVTLIGLCFVCWIGYGRFDAVGWVLSLTGWVLLDIFVVSPLIYLAVVPKPVHKHIKDVANLTPYEQKVRQRELETNERVEKILKKYKKSGRQVYDEDGNGIEDDRY